VLKKEIPSANEAQVLSFGEDLGEAKEKFVLTNPCIELRLIIEKF
jgi:hypothetical protein